MRSAQQTRTSARKQGGSHRKLPCLRYGSQTVHLSVKTNQISIIVQTGNYKVPIDLAGISGYNGIEVIYLLGMAFASSMPSASSPFSSILSRAFKADNRSSLPAQRAALKEKLAAYKAQVSGADRADTDKAKRKEETL